jgi:hypothetical protein
MAAGEVFAQLEGIVTDATIGHDGSIDSFSLMFAHSTDLSISR